MNALEGGTEVNITVSLNANIPATRQTWYAILTMQADEFSIYRVLGADRRSRAFSLPFEADGTTRQVRINIRLCGGGEAKLFHGFVSDLPAPALSAFHLGRYLGTANASNCDNIVRLQADVMPAGTQIYNTSDNELQISDGTNCLTLSTN